jgi:hypothetical protein
MRRPRVDLRLATNDSAGWRPRRLVYTFFALASLLLVPWVGLLSAELPSKHQSAHWDIAWVGFDIVLALVLLAVAITSWLRSRWLEGSATAAATLLFTDAWFDVLTSNPGDDFTFAAAEAAFAEVPLALLCFWIGVRTERFLRETDRLRS